MTLDDVEVDGMVVVIIACANIYIPNSDLVDVEEAKAKLLATKQKLELELERSRNMLSNSNFIQKAPKSKIDAEKAKLVSYEAQYNEVIDALAKL